MIIIICHIYITNWSKVLMKHEQILPETFNKNAGALKLMNTYGLDSIYAIEFYTLLRKPQEKIFKNGVKRLIETWVYNEA